MLKIKAYSPKGLVIRGATKEQAQAIAAQLGAKVCTSYNPKLKGWSFSRKREEQIAAIVAGMGTTSPEVVADTLPGKWGLLATG